MKRRICNIFTILALGLACAHAQVRPQELEIASLRFEGNETFRDDDLLSVIRTRETPAGFWKFLYKISEKLGDKPEYFDPPQFLQK